MKKITSFLILLITLNTVAQLTYVPDDNFEQALIGLGYDTGALDDYVPTVNISTVTSLDVSFKSITDLTGIEDFSLLVFLNCSSNQLTSLDISQNTALTYLSCVGNQLTSLDISQNTALTYLNCGLNQLSTLDVSQNTALTELLCFHNQLTSLNINQNTALYSLACNNNQLTSLDLSQNIALTEFGCATNQLTSLDVSQNTVLTFLHLYNNQLTNLDTSHNTILTSLYCGLNQLTSLGISQNTALTHLDCSQNQLTSLDVNQNTALYSLACSVNLLASLDVSQNIALEDLFCQNNQLTNLNVKNGNNINSYYFYAYDNPNLTCIEVDDAAWSTDNWTDIDATAYFSENCGTAVVNDLNNQLEKLQIINYQEEGVKVKTSNGSVITQLAIYDVLGKLVIKVKSNQSQFTIQNPNLKKGAILFVKVQLESGQVINSKFIKY